jgi:cellulose biosynthesis protein BcsQ
VELNLQWVGLIVTVGLAAAGALWWAIKTWIHNCHLQTANANLQNKIVEQRDEIALLNKQTADAGAPGDLQALTDELQRTLSEKERILTTGNQLVEVYNDLKRRSQNDISRLVNEKQVAEEELQRIAARNEEFSRQIHELENQIDGIREQDGRLWRRPLSSSATEFRSIAERGFPIISVLNLKGGVGKTTITAHLAGILGQKGYRVLMVDCDYQRSLSMMVASAQDRTIISLQRRCLQHFLAGDSHGSRALLACAHEVGTAMPGCSIVTNSDARDKSSASDSLEETENRLMAEWTVRTIDEIRLSLRKGLHAPELTRRFDYVILDCPPRLTTACVNALAASDYVLVPVIPDALSARSVPELLRTLNDLRTDLLANLSVLGVVANLATLREGKLIEQESEVWDRLQYGLGAVWGAPIRFFSTLIPNKSIFGRAAGSLGEGELRLALRDAAIQNCFTKLVSEIEREVKNHERSHAAAVSA